MTAREMAIAAVRDELGIAVQPGRVLRAIESAGLEVIDRAELERLRLAEAWAEAKETARTCACALGKDGWCDHDRAADAALDAYRTARKEGKK